MEELSRSHIFSCGGELGEIPNFDICGTFFRVKLFENIGAETETGESLNKDSEPQTDESEPKLSRVRKEIVL